MIRKPNVNFNKVVNMLNEGVYQDGNSMGEKLKLSRAAIWKIIKKLENYGIPIKSMKGKGYALLEPLILLDLHKIKKKLIHQKLNIILLESVSSTNEYLISAKKHASIKICLAEQQTAGKGRLNRQWYSPFGKNIYLSCLYPFQKDISELAGLSLVISLAIIKTLKDWGIKQGLSVKWPNDVMYDNQKLSGTLIEIQAESHGFCFATIGIGMNVNMIENAGSNAISQAWISLRQILGKSVDRNEIVAFLINHLIHYLQQFDAHGFAIFKNEWNVSDGLYHKNITVKNLNEKTKGKVMGITDQGHLLLQLEGGKLCAFSSGDTSIIKI